MDDAPGREELGGQMPRQGGAGRTDSRARRLPWLLSSETSIQAAPPSAPGRRWGQQEQQAPLKTPTVCNVGHKLGQVVAADCQSGGVPACGGGASREEAPARIHKRAGTASAESARGGSQLGIAEGPDCLAAQKRNQAHLLVSSSLSSTRSSWQLLSTSFSAFSRQKASALGRVWTVLAL